MSSRLMLTLAVVIAVIFAAIVYDAGLRPPQTAVSPQPAIVPVPVPVPEANILPQLPQVTLKDAPIHAVPEDTVLPADRNADGSIREHHVSDEVANGPRQISTIPPPPKQFAGIASISGAITLDIGKTKVSLFGLKPALASDRCGLAEEAICGEQARKALSGVIGPGGTIACHIPNPNATTTLAYAICLSPTGIDLGGVLIAEGFALADTAQSYDYVGAESVARSQKRGLWANR